MGELGDELSRHRLRFGSLALLVVATAAGAFCLSVVHNWVAVAMLVPVALVGWLVVTRGRDLLVVYRDGFTLRHRGRVRACRWGEIRSADVRMSWDRRLRVHAVTTRGGERIAFGRFMGGLDALHRANQTRGGRDQVVEYAPGGDGIGAPLATYRVRRRRWDLMALLLPGFLLLVAVFLVYAVLAVPDRDPGDIAIAIGCVTAALAFGALLLWVVRGDRDDELRIHEEGFAYRHRRSVWECRWDEIADFQHDRRGDLASVMKLDGTWISLSSSLPEVQQFVAPRVQRLPRP
ncbi:hypothetical protein [Phytohabitans suffuscus]|uniref:Uncharacterized protein n=1 Tax=Phytohabitans suffuscus TaxID=624315 RepID=A0A6F8YUL6_9ACTN|nr:hypothetical protein [Phytohabitans suffuscus]BCB89673.1 hypothetical protein Psuf_069860 [Phytohabitans suffuscus]